MSYTRVNIGLFRVSKEEEGLQDLDLQMKKVLDKFGIQKNNIKIYQERGSAYDIDKFTKRKEFIRLLDDVFDAKNTSVLDVFLGKVPKAQVNLYIWDYSRIMRNLEYSLFFSILCTLGDVTIYSHKDGVFIVQPGMTPTEKLVKYLDLSIKAYSGEEYSHNISANVRKSVIPKNGVSYSNKGNKWGRKFINTKKEKISISEDRLSELTSFIKKRVRHYVNKKTTGYYDRIIDEVKKEFSIIISRAYINKIKKTI